MLTRWRAVAVVGIVLLMLSGQTTSTAWLGRWVDGFRGSVVVVEVRPLDEAGTASHGSRTGERSSARGDVDSVLVSARCAEPKQVASGNAKAPSALGSSPRTGAVEWCEFRYRLGSRALEAHQLRHGVEHKRFLDQRYGFYNHRLLAAYSDVGSSWVTQIVCDGIALALVVLAACLCGWHPSKDLASSRAFLGHGISSVFVLIAPLMATAVFAFLLDSFAAMQIGFEPVSGKPGLWARAAGLVTVTPIVEELLYRYVILGYLLRWARPWMALLLVSLVFAWNHDAADVAVTLQIFVSGLVMGGVFLRYRLMWLVIVSHAIVNAPSAIRMIEASNAL